MIWMGSYGAISAKPIKMYTTVAWMKSLQRKRAASKESPRGHFFRYNGKRFMLKESHHPKQVGEACVAIAAMMSSI